MAKQIFNEPELYLLKNWSNAALLEASMDNVREKYGQIFTKALDAVREEHQELDFPSLHVTSGRGHVGIGKKAWSSMYAQWPSGFWIGCISLENLVSEDEDPPEASVWINPPKTVELDLKLAADTLHDVARKVLTKEELARVDVEIKKSEASLWYNLPESRQELLEMLLTDEARAFVECMGVHFELLARFIPTIDEIYAKAKRPKSR